MQLKEKLADVQKQLQKQKIDGWLFYDFRRSNEIACRFLDISSDQFLTRRFFYWIPKKGSPVKIVHGIESHVLSHLPGNTLTYRSWQELETNLQNTLKGCKHAAMEYSPYNALPYLSKVDAGTVDLIRKFGVQVVTSATLLQYYTSIWSDFQLQSHLAATDVLCRTVDQAWTFIAQHLKSNISITEYAVQQFILQKFEQQNCVMAGTPICAVNEHSALPHYCAEKKESAAIKIGDFILIDLWCKQDLPDAVYADITRVGVAAPRPTNRQQEIFEIVKRARDAATVFVENQLSQGAAIKGCEVDQVCRQVITEAGYGDYFTHRTGHNIDQEDHGNGTHIDSLETQDERLLLPRTCFSIEPGIYLPDEFGVRLEYDLFIHSNGKVQITGGIQQEITCLDLS